MHKVMGICIPSYLSSLKYHFENYIPGQEMENCDWIRDPFNTELNGSIFSVTVGKQLICLSSETSPKIKFCTHVSYRILDLCAS
jgi:hypothetical protein